MSLKLDLSTDGGIHQRIYVHESLYDKFVSSYVDTVKVNLCIGQ